MNTRNIQYTGGSSYTVTLPKKWIIEQGVDASKELFFTEFPTGELLILPKKPARIRSARLDISYIKKEQIKRELIGLFVSGIDEIDITSLSITTEERTFIRHISHKLFGFEIFEETNRRILMKNTATTIISAEEYCKKMLKQIITMYTDLLLAVATTDKKLARDILLRDQEIDRIHLVILRQFSTILYSHLPQTDAHLSASDLRFYEHVAIRMERLADHIVRMARTVLMLKNGQHIQLNKFEMARMKKLVKYFSLLETVLFPLHIRNAHMLLDLFETQPKHSYLNHKMITISSINILIEDSMDRIRSYIANIAEETINYSYIKGHS